MTHDEEAPTAQDYIAALEQQRNDALNEVVNLRAELAALKRQLVAFENDNGQPISQA